MANRYSKQIENPEHIAKALGLNLSISTKHSIEICNLLRKKKLEKAKTILENAIAGKAPIPFKRFKLNIGHKKGKIAAGRYPIKACKEILRLLNSAEANAQFKGLNTSNLIISHMAANRAPQQWRYGRQRRRKAKRTHIQVHLEEKAEKEKIKKEPKKEEKKPDEKPEPKKEVPKKEEKKVEEKPQEKKEVPKPKQDENKKPTKLGPKTGGFQE